MNERTSFRSTCRWRRTRWTTSIWSSGRLQDAPKRLAPSVRAAIARVDKEQLVSVQRRDDARGRRVGRDRAPSVPGGDGDDVCRAGAAAGDGRRVRDPRLFRPAAGARLRRAAGRSAPRRRDVLRMVVASAVRVIAAGAVIGLALVGGARPAADDACCSASSRWTRRRLRA